MRVIYDPLTDLIYIAEFYLFRKNLFRALDILRADERHCYFTKGKYLSNRCIIMGGF